RSGRSGVALVAFITFDAASVLVGAVAVVDDQVAVAVDFGFGYASAVGPVFAVFTINAVFAVSSRIAFVAFDCSGCFLFAVAVVDDEFTFVVDFGFRYTSAVGSVFTVLAVDAVCTVFAVGSVFTILTVCALDVAGVLVGAVV
ncbi:hypothetical protein, partial [Synergistes jonesii]|uniref:hypothetical protein n=1 Tax=Synergistes jonesii TaxID=2754 RepID=UPI001495F68B